MSDLTKQQFDKWLHEIVAESTDGQRIQRRDCMTVDQELTSFEAWKASRESLVIELPESFEFHDPYEAGLAISACKESILISGVKIK